ncbi:MAG: recombinase RecA [Cytophagales bacterium]|nr:recombinase RecA [Cytophagales bacterium]
MISDIAAKKERLNGYINKLEKEYGVGTIMTSLNGSSVVDIESISTGSLSLDLALGVGGLPRGRIVEIYGPESSGKTTLSLQCIVEAQKLGGMAVFIDAEYAFDKSYAEKLGVDFERLLLAQPNNGEEALEIASELIKSGEIDICVIDSVAALVPKAELEGEIGENRIGTQARLMSQALRKLTGVVSKTNAICIFINQLREKIGVMFGNPETTPGGNALKYYSSVRLDIRRVSQIKNDKGDISGNRTRVKVVKNKVAPPFKIVEFDIFYGEGVSKVGEIVDIAIAKKIIQKNGSWFSFEGSMLAQGRDSVVAVFKNDHDLATKVENLIKKT